MYKVHQQYTPYERFEGVLKSKFTKITYLKSLKHFLEFSRLENYTDLITKLSDEEKHNLVSDYLMYIKNNKNLSTSTILVAYSTIKKFYSVNRVRLDWDHLKHFKESSRKKRIEDRLYTKEEIDQMLIHADLRDKVVIYTLLSTGMRVGGLAGIQIKDIEYIEQYKLYKFTVYANDKDSIEERYVTYCTPECAEIIKKYLKFREMQGDILKPNSPLIYRKIMRYDMKKKQSVMINQFDEQLDNISVSVIVMRLQRKSAVLPKEIQTEENIGKIRKPIMRCHAFRKMFNTICIRNNVNHTIKEKLMGHKTGLKLDYSYYRPDNDKDELLQEYLKVINDLTINDENRLKKENQELKQQDDYQKYVIDKKIMEMEEQNKILSQKLIKYEEHVKYIKECEQKIDTIIESKFEEKNINREYESIPVNQKGKKDSVFKNLLEIRKKRIKLENDHLNLIREHSDDDYY
jgi:integrase